MLRHWTFSFCFLTSHFLDFNPVFQLHHLFYTFFFVNLLHFVSCFLVFSGLFISFPLHPLVPLHTQHVSLLLSLSDFYFLHLFTCWFLVPFSIFLLCPNFSFYLFHRTLRIFDDVCFSSFFTFPSLPFFLSTFPKPSPSSSHPPFPASSDLLPALPSFLPRLTVHDVLPLDPIHLCPPTAGLLPSPLAPSPPSVHPSLSTRCRLGLRQASSYQATG